MTYCTWISCRDSDFFWDSVCYKLGAICARKYWINASRESDRRAYARESFYSMSNLQRGKRVNFIQEEAEKISNMVRKFLYKIVREKNSLGVCVWKVRIQIETVTDAADKTVNGCHKNHAYTSIYFIVLSHSRHLKQAWLQIIFVTLSGFLGPEVPLAYSFFNVCAFVQIINKTDWQFK